MVQEYQNWGEQFKIEFDIKITKRPNNLQWINVIHFTANGDHHAYGDRIPAVFICWDGKVYFFSAISGNHNHEETFDYELEQMYHIVIQQYKGLNDDYWFEIVIDGDSKVKIQNTQQQSFSNVKFYASDPWFDPFSSEFGCIGNVTISK